MKFLVLTKATKDSEAGKFPEDKHLMEMMRFNEEMVNAGVLLDAGGLFPSSQGKRISVKGKDRKIVDGPFAETKELIAGYWMIQAKSFDEVMEWMNRCPLADGAELEVRRLIDVGEFEASDEVHAMHQKLEDKVQR